jgi:hypothetical protein
MMIELDRGYAHLIFPYGVLYEQQFGDDVY